MEILVIIAIVVALVLAFRLAAGALDGDRIREYLEQRGCRLLSRQWTPFGPGWFGDHSSRLYLIEYRDAAGNRCSASCKTSMLAGVYLTDQRVIEAAAPPEAEDLTAGADAAKPSGSTAAELARLQAENAALRARLQRSEPES